MGILSKFSRGSGLEARAARSLALTATSFAASQIIRLASNLILTRLLFPEAFGLMALVMVVIIGLGQFSDVGISPAIMQSRRGDDQDFLNTAWTIQIFRGFCLWLTASALAWPVAALYGEPDLAALLPVAAFTLFINGFRTTRLETSQRHLQFGRITVLDLSGQLISVLISILLAWWLRSVWALVVGNVVAAFFSVLLYQFYLKGPKNRLHLERAAVHELIHFGKWIFLATVCGFVLSQSDKLILGKYLSLEQFGVYNIGFFLASVPMLLGHAVNNRILIPIYREKPPQVSVENFLALRRMRMAMTGVLMVLVVAFSATGVWLVTLLYDPRYYDAGAIVTVLSIMHIPHIIILTYDQAAVAAGDTRRFFVLALAKAAFMVAGLIIGLEHAGLLGALLGQGAAMIAIYPVVVWLARRMHAWDPQHDIFFAVLGLLIGAICFWLNWSAIMDLWTKAQI